jgi:hypothetical protein
MDLYDTDRNQVIEWAEFEAFVMEAMSTGPAWDHGEDVDETEYAWAACQGTVSGTLTEE